MRACRVTRSSASPTSWGSTRRCSCCYRPPRQRTNGFAVPIPSPCSAGAPRWIECSRATSPTCTRYGSTSTRSAAERQSSTVTHMSAPAEDPPLTEVRWQPCFRVIPSRFPTIHLFERIADPADWEALYWLESLTNPRLRDEVGDIELVPPDERAFGPGGSVIMAPFTHLDPAGSRFADGTFGAFYAAAEL